MQSQTVITLTLLSLFKICYCEYGDSDIVTSPNGTIFYYAYGSNLLTKRLHLNNPSAVFYSIAKLKNHRLDFNMFVEAWQGAVATIVEDEEEEVWGTVWTISADKLHHLDQQEGVADGWYFAKNVTLTTPSGQQLVARTYEETINPNKTASTDIPVERRPSSTYLELLPATLYADPVAYASDNGVVKIEDLKRLMSNSKSPGTGKQRDARDDSRRSRSFVFVIALGAIESHLPPECIGFIFSFPTNGKMASKVRRDQLGYPF